RAEALRPILSAVRAAAAASAAREVPVLVKIAPDLADADVDAVARLAGELGLAGVVAANTTIAHDYGPGGLSGAPLLDRGRGPGRGTGGPGAPHPRPGCRDHRCGRDLHRRPRSAVPGRRGHRGAGLHRVHLPRTGLARPGEPGTGLWPGQLARLIRRAVPERGLFLSGACS